MSNLPILLDQITEARIASELELEIAATNYKRLLEKGQTFVCTKENIKDGAELLEKIRSVRKMLKEKKEEKKKPLTAAGKAIESGYKKVDTPLGELEFNLQREVVHINDLLEKERRQARFEQVRIDMILKAIPLFVNDMAKQIIEAPNDQELVRLQKVIGSQKARTEFYAEFIEQFREACNGLTPLINQRKEFLRKESQLKVQQQQAVVAGDVHEQVKIREEMELLEAELGENVIRVKEKAFEQAGAIETVVGEPLVETVKPYRTQWKWRVDDIQLLAKKLPACVKLVVDEEVAEAIFQEKKKAGDLSGEDEIAFNGLVFYLQKFI